MPRPSSATLAQARAQLPAAAVRGARAAPRPSLRAAGTAARRATAAAATPSPSASASVSGVRPFSSSHARRQGGGTKSPFQAFVDTLREELRKSQEMQENMRQLQGEAGKLQDSETMKKMREAYERARIVTSIKENPRLQAAADALRKTGGNVGDAVGATLRQMEESELIKGLGAISSRLARQLADSTAPVRNTEAYRELAQTLSDAFDDGGSALRIQADPAADAREVRRIKREARLRKIGRQPPRADVEGEAAIAKAMAPREEEMDDPLAAAAAAAAAAGAAAGAEQAKQTSEQPGAEGAEGAAEGTAAPGAAPGATPSPQPHKARPLGFAARVRSVQENAAAGEALVLRPEPAYKQAWASFRETNPLMRKLGEMRMAYDESENPVVERLRSITDTIGGWFQENETARVVAAFKAMEPTFTLEGFQKELREYVVPEVIDAYHGAARHLLRQWCGEATYNVLMATIDPYVQKGAIAHGRLLDLKNIEILQARLLENNVPVVVVSFTSQELMYFKDAKTGEVMAGREDQADMCRYAMVLTRVEEEMDNEITGGWKVVELARRGQAAFL